MRRSRYDKPLKVEVSYVPCDPKEWEEAWDILAQLFVDAYLNGRLNKYREPERRSEYEHDPNKG